MPPKTKAVKQPATPSKLNRGWKHSTKSMMQEKTWPQWWEKIVDCVILIRILLQSQVKV
jgi:hypothetical protein